MQLSSLQGDNEFWRFSLAVYHAAGVAEECLALQQALGIDVNLLLFCAWLGAARHIALTEANIESARRVVEPWHQQAVRPLRAVRQQLKASFGHECEPFRVRVKGLELEAEQIEQAMLFAHAQELLGPVARGDPRAIVGENIRMFLQMSGAEGPPCSDALPTDRLIESAALAVNGS